MSWLKDESKNGCESIWIILRVWIKIFYEPLIVCMENNIVAAGGEQGPVEWEVVEA